MKNLPLFLLLAICCRFSIATAQAPTNNDVYMQIHNKPVKILELSQYTAVMRTYKDTIIQAKGHSKKLANFPLSTSVAHMCVKPSEILHYKREFFEEKKLGLTWMRITNDSLLEGGKVYSRLMGVTDSTVFFEMPILCARIDSVTQIDPITLEETLSIQTNTIFTFQHNFGIFSKNELIAALKNKFGIEKDSHYWLEHIEMKYATSKNCNYVELYYENADSLQAALDKLDNLSDNSAIIINALFLRDKYTKERFTIGEEIGLITIKN